jgi:hypothetical protein
MVEALDTEIGRLLSSLPPAVLANTMVLFVGDNGTNAKVTVPPFDVDHAKSTLYEGGINVPLIVSGPEVQVPGSEVSALVDTTDLFATVLELAGSSAASRAPLDSVSLVPYFADPGTPPARSFAYAELFVPGGPMERTNLFTTPLPPVPGFTCQQDLGYGGPGSTVLSVCGPPLYGGYLDGDVGAQLLVQGAPADARGFLHMGTTLDPLPMFGGIVAPNPPLQTTAFTTDLTGSWQTTVASDAGFVGLRYYQALVMSTQPEGFDITNAVAVDTLPADMEAIRNHRFKLIRDNSASVEELFDLFADPFEQTNLLAGNGLTTEQQSHYASLRKQLFALRDRGSPLGSR